MNLGPALFPFLFGLEAIASTVPTTTTSSNHAASNNDDDGTSKIVLSAAAASDIDEISTSLEENHHHPSSHPMKAMMNHGKSGGSKQYFRKNESTLTNQHEEAAKYDDGAAAAVKEEDDDTKVGIDSGLLGHEEVADDVSSLEPPINNNDSYHHQDDTTDGISSVAARRHLGLNTSPDDIFKLTGLNNEYTYCDALCGGVRPTITQSGNDFSELVQQCFGVNLPENYSGYYGYGDSDSSDYDFIIPGYTPRRGRRLQQVDDDVDRSKCPSYIDHENVPLGCWDTSKVTDMSYAFTFQSINDPTIQCWDLSSVTNTAGMFYQAFEFNQPINEWNTSSVTNGKYMFAYAEAFNQPIEDWDVGSMTNMYGMFDSAPYFDQPLDGWNVASASDMGKMFLNATSFDQCLSTWADKTSDDVDTYSMLDSTSCPNDVADPSRGPWCQGPSQGCGQVVPTTEPVPSVAPSASPTDMVAPTSSPTKGPACKNKKSKHEDGFLVQTNPKKPNKLTRRTCYWIGKDDLCNKKVKRGKNKFVKAKSLCPKSCDQCEKRCKDQKPKYQNGFLIQTIDEKKNRLVRLSCSEIAEGGFCGKNIKMKKGSYGKTIKTVKARNICQRSCNKCDNIFDISPTASPTRPPECKNDGGSSKKYKIITNAKKNRARKYTCKEIRKKGLCKSKLYKKPKISAKKRCKKACGVCKK